jgi:hypothetical protein
MNGTEATQMRLLGMIFCLIGCVGCAATPYRYGGDYFTDCDAPLKPNECQVERGSRRPILDGVGWVVGVPAKILMLNHRIDNHNVSEETEADLKEYLACNSLAKVKVRINEYDPCGEWHRLGENKSVAWPIRYTVGTLSVLGYTLLPGRVFGNDNYNPFTNTISLYSDVPAAAIYQGGAAKDYAQHNYKGMYALARVLPGVGLIWHEAHASSDTIGYLLENGTSQEVKEGYRTVYPSYVLRGCPSVILGEVPMVLPALAVGHVAGQSKAAYVPKDQSPIMPASHAPHAAGAEPRMQTIQ